MRSHEFVLAQLAALLTPEAEGGEGFLTSLTDFDEPLPPARGSGERCKSFSPSGVRKAPSFQNSVRSEICQDCSSSKMLND